jgi:REP element-mobilizing transposase RayT
MPRKARIDAPGALHHVIARGIDRQKIFADDLDRQKFLDRLSDLLIDTHTACYGWALIPNHFHLLLRTGDTTISTVMRRLLTGYAVNFNRRHRRHGHLFQNRYKSILCQEDTYLLELVRYIHLNPLRAKLVKDYKDLGKFIFCGHGAILGRSHYTFQDSAYVLQLFGENIRASRRKYQEFVRSGSEKGRRPDLVGGGLVRSQGGWSAVKALRRIDDYQKGDERILGDSDFVKNVLSKANERMEQKYRLAAEGFDLKQVAERVAELMGMGGEEVMARGKGHRTVRARSLLCYWAVDRLGVSQTHLAQILHLTQSAISQAVGRGKRLVQKHGYSLTK